MGYINLNKCYDLRNVLWDATIKVTSPGILLKSIIERKNGKNTYLKLSSYSLPFGVYGNEALFELLNSRLGSLLGLNVLNYDLISAFVILDGKEFKTLVSKCEDFGELGYKKISFGKFYQQYRNGEESPLALCKRYGIESSIYEMFLFDFIICNLDRHDSNIYLLQNEDIVKVTSLFDNSFCSMFNKTENEIKNRAYYNDESKTNNYIGSKLLIENLYNIDKPVRIRSLRSSDREKLFQGIGKVTTREFRDYYWWFVNRRIEHVKSLKIPFIKWY